MASSEVKVKDENNIAWRRDPRVAAVIEKLLYEYEELQPHSTTRTYGRKHREWRDWCQRNYPPVPPTWSPFATPWDGNALPGDLVDEGKMLLFITEVANRSPRSGKRLQEERRRRQVIDLTADDDDDAAASNVDAAADGGEDFGGDSSLKVKYGTVRSYVAAVQRLYEEQKSRGLNPAPRPQGIPLRALKARILRQSYAKSREELEDRGEGTIKDAYSVAQIPHHTAAVWSEQKAIACAFRTQVDFLLGNHMLLRSSNRLPIELPDCFCLDLPNEGVQRGGEMATTKALVILMRQGKTNQHGRMEYGAALRHRDPKACLISAFAFWFFWRWEVEGEPFPRFTHSQDWYHIKVLRQSLGTLTHQLSSQTAGSWTRKMYDKCGIKTSKVSHAPRVASAQNADLAGVSEASIRRAGRWNNSDAMTGCYLTSLPRQFMRSTADFDPDWAGSYYIPRSTVAPPPSLATAIWPELEQWQEKLDTGAIERNKAAGAFIELLSWFRLIVLQDAPFLMSDFPGHPLFKHPVFHSVDFTVFAAQVKDVHNQTAIDIHSETIQRAVPAVAEKLRVVATQQITAEATIRRLAAEIEAMRAEVHDLRNLSWRVTMDVTPNGMDLIQIHQFDHQGQQDQQQQQQQQQQSVPRGPQPQHLNRPPLTPPILTAAAAAARQKPPQYRLPRTTKSIVGLLKIWREGLVGMPSIDALEARWGARWRPSSEKSFFCKRRIIIDEVVRRAAATGGTEYDIAQQMDVERGTASLDKVTKVLRSQRNGNHGDNGDNGCVS